MRGRSGQYWISRWLRQLIAAAAAVMMMLLTGVLSAQAASTPPALTGWIRHNATVLGTVDPAAPLDDLAPLGRSIGNAAQNLRWWQELTGNKIVYWAASPPPDP